MTKNKNVGLSPSQVNKALDGYQEFVVIGHVHPEGDVIGSVFAMHSMLKRLGKQASIICQDRIPPRFSVLSSPDWKLADGLVTPFSPEACVILDCGALDRIGRVQSIVGSRTKIFNVDHHASNKFFGTYNYVDDLAMSTGQLVWALFDDRKMTLTADEARWLYAALATDTGWFRYGHIDSKLLAFAAELAGNGFSVMDLNEKLCTRFSLNQLHLFSKLLARVRIEHPGLVAWSYVCFEDLEMFGLHRTDTEDFVDFLHYLKGPQISFFLVEFEPGRLSISLRSRGPFTVHDIALAWGGGGHRHSAGCVLDGSVEETAKRILEMVRLKIEVATVAS